MKTILVPYHEETAARAALEAAVNIAKHYDAYVEGLFVLADPVLNMAPGLIVPPEYLTAAVEEWRSFADRARKEFKQTTDAHGLSMREPEAVGPGPAASWHEKVGDEAEVVGLHGRLFDLIVVGRASDPASGTGADVLEAALFEAGRPVLLVPPQTAPKVNGKVVVAWNGSIEAARTLAFGMPWVRAAERVEVLTVEGNTFPGPTNADAVAYLARQGIAATGRTLAADERPPGEIILDEAGDVDADLILKGAFTQSRFRQVVFGGATKHIIDYAKIPILLAH